MKQKIAAIMLLLSCTALTGCGEESSDLLSDTESAETTTTAATTDVPAPIAGKDDYIGTWIMDYYGEPGADNAAFSVKTWWGINFPEYREFMNLELREDGTFFWEDELWENRAEGKWNYNADGTLSLDFPGDEMFGYSGGRGTTTCTLLDDGSVYFHWDANDLISDIQFHAVFVRGDSVYDDAASLGYAQMKEALNGFWIPDTVRTAAYSAEDRAFSLQSEGDYDKDDADAWYYEETAELRGMKLAFSDDGTLTLTVTDADGAVHTMSGAIVYNTDGVCYYSAKSTENADDKKAASENGIFVRSGDTLSYIRSDSAKSSDGTVECVEVLLKAVTEDEYNAYDMNTVLCP